MKDFLSIAIVQTELRITQSRSILGAEDVSLTCPFHQHERERTWIRGFGWSIRHQSSFRFGSIIFGATRFLSRQSKQSNEIITREEVSYIENEHLCSVVVFMCTNDTLEFRFQKTNWTIDTHNQRSIETMPIPFNRNSAVLSRYLVERTSPVDVCWWSISGFAWTSASVLIAAECCFAVARSFTSPDAACRFVRCRPALLKKLPSLSLSSSSPKSEAWQYTDEVVRLEFRRSLKLTWSIRAACSSSSWTLTISPDVSGRSGSAGSSSLFGTSSWDKMSDGDDARATLALSQSMTCS